MLQLRPLGVQVIDRQRVIPAAWYKNRQCFACFLATIRTWTIMKECSRRLRVDAPQRWTDSVPNKPSRMKRRLLNLPLMKGLLDVLPVVSAHHFFTQQCRCSPLSVENHLAERHRLMKSVNLKSSCIFWKGRQLDACSPLRGLHFSSNTNSFLSETASVASSCAPSVVQKVC
jgi:hypothetical protein